MKRGLRGGDGDSQFLDGQTSFFPEAESPSSLTDASGIVVPATVEFRNRMKPIGCQSSNVINAGTASSHASCAAGDGT